MTLSKADVLQSLSFGERVAEEEIQALERYFVQTDQWRQLYAGDADVVYGAKGAGKSALYANLLSHETQLKQRGVLLVAGENPRGAPVFKDLVDDPPTTEQEFRNLWKLYLLQLVGEKFRADRLSSDEAARLVSTLEGSNLLPKGGGLKAFVRSAIDYVRYFTKPEGVEGTIKLDPATGMPSGVGGKVLFREPNAAAFAAGAVSVESLFSQANMALGHSGLELWMLMDRLDVAFAENLDLEQNALRALFIAYSDVRTFDHIKLKIFLRSDIWERITAVGFREASHITKTLTISWDEKSLMNLVIRRVLQSPKVGEYYHITSDDVLADVARQKELFYRLFPHQVDVGSRRPTTFDWVRTRAQDGTRHTAPREVIHLLSEARSIQLRRLEIGESLPAGDPLIAGATLKSALKEVSKVRLEQTLLAEFPSLRPYILKLRGAKAQQSVGSLEEIWKEGKDRAAEIATLLVENGFFERRGSRDDPDFWVPFLYRDALEMTQGAAD